MDGAGQMRWRVDFLASLFHQNACGVDARGRMAFRFEDHRAKPTRRSGLGAKQSCKACADNGEIEILHAASQAMLAGRLSGVTLSKVT